MSQESKKYRPNVAAIVLSSEYPFACKYMLCLRNDIKDVWQFPQGGIDAGETPRVAILRELKEEIGTDEVEIIAEDPEWKSYDFPNTIVKKMYPFDGQIQKYFLVRLKNNSKVNLATKNPEFEEYKFVEYGGLFKNVSKFKLQVYKKVIQHFKSEGYL